MSGLIEQRASTSIDSQSTTRLPASKQFLTQEYRKLYFQKEVGEE